MPQATDPALGINSWLEDELYHQYQFDRKSVDEGWTTMFQEAGHNGQTTVTAPPQEPEPPVEEPPSEEPAAQEPPAPAPIPQESRPQAANVEPEPKTPVTPEATT